MSFRFKIFLIKTNVAAVVILVCLVPLVVSQRRRTTTRTTTTRWVEDPVYVQNFVSRMMSKNPLKDEPVELGVTGISYGPNLGYEPYWTNVPHRLWTDKCKRCPTLFKRYSMVCAMDSTNEVLVNITMCKLLQMNCLKGIAEGESTGKYKDFQGEYYVVQEGWARFAVRHQRDLVVQLSQSMDQNYPRYTIYIDSWLWARWARFDKNDGKYQWQWYRPPSLLGRDEWTEYVIRWNSSSGWLLITRADFDVWTYNPEGYERFAFNITDPDPFPIKYIAISGGDGYSGEWMIKGFIVSDITPCKGTRPGMAKALVTNPTAVPVILSRHSPINIGFFSRVDYAGVQGGNATHLGNVSFLTREEY